MDSKIFKEIHPEEYKKQQDLLKQKEAEDKEWRAKMKQKMTELASEVNFDVDEFISTTQQLKEQTKGRIKALKKLKKKYKHL